LLTDTLQTIAVDIATAPDTSTTIHAAHRCVSIAAAIICRITCLALSAHTFWRQPTAIIAVAARNTRPRPVTLNTVGCLGCTAVAVCVIAGPTITAYALAGVGIITVCIRLTGNTLIAIQAIDAIGRVYIAAFVARQVTRFALS
jgi:hypothetical protein